MKQANAILQKSCGKLAVILEAMNNGHLSEETQFGLRSVIEEVKSDVESVGAMVQADQRQ